MLPCFCLLQFSGSTKLAQSKFTSDDTIRGIMQQLPLAVCTHNVPGRPSSSAQAYAESAAVVKWAGGWMKWGNNITKNKSATQFLKIQINKPTCRLCRKVPEIWILHYFGWSDASSRLLLPLRQTDLWLAHDRETKQFYTVPTSRCSQHPTTAPKCPKHRKIRRKPENTGLCPWKDVFLGTYYMLVSTYGCMCVNGRLMGESSWIRVTIKVSY